jgi:hypothetical protein
MASHVHCRVVSPRGTHPQDELFPYIADEHPIIQSALSQSQPSQRLSHEGDRPSRTNLRVFYDGDRPSRTNLQDALSTTMSGLPTITNAQRRWSHVTAFPAPSRQRPICPVLFVQEPVLQLLPLNTRHLYSSQACLQRCSS